MSTLVALKDHLMTALATSALLGGGAMVIGHEVNIGRHAERIERIEKLDDSMDTLTKELGATRESIARLEARQDATDARK